MSVTSNPPGALTVRPIAISGHCAGSRWVPADIDRLARTIAVISMGQASHAAQIIRKVLLAEPPINVEALRTAAKDRLVVGTTEEQRRVRRYHRDGLILKQSPGSSPSKQ